MVASTTPGIVLRPETPEDDPLLYCLYSSTREEELALTGWTQAERERFLQMQFSAQRRGYRHTFPAASFDIVLVGGKPVGRIIVDRGRKEIRLVDLVIENAQRNKGIGTALMRQLCQESAASHMPLRLKVIRGSRASQWYQRLGFHLIDDGEVYLEMEYHSQHAP